jgi:hypothetical protein
MKHITVLLILVLFIGCNSGSSNVEKPTQTEKAADSKSGDSANAGAGAQEKKETTEVKNADSNSNQPESSLQTKGPKTVREFFNLLPQKYFRLEGCEPAKDKNCEKARAEYVKNYLEIEDTKNGYWKSSCDGAQSCLTMALFKRPNGTYIVHLLTEFEGGEDSYFLDYKDGKWMDIGAKIIPEYSTKNTYVPPRVGTTIEVFKKNFPEPNYSERGDKIYNLDWKDGKFVKRT